MIFAKGRCGRIKNKNTKTLKLLCQAGALAGSSQEELVALHKKPKGTIKRWSNEVFALDAGEQVDIFKTAIKASGVSLCYTASVAARVAAEDILLRIEQDKSNILLRQSICGRLAQLKEEGLQKSEEAEQLNAQLKELYFIQDSSLSAYLKSLQKLAELPPSSGRP